MTDTRILHDVEQGMAVFVDGQGNAFGSVFTVGGDLTPAQQVAEGFLTYVLGLGFEPSRMDPATLHNLRARWEQAN